MKTKQFLLTVVLSAFFWSCSSIITKTEFYRPIINDLQNGNYLAASKKLQAAELDGDYADKDGVLLYLDKGIINHYAERYKESNAAFEKAEYLIDSFYTKSISKGAASLLLNDNALAYSGEVYENLYVNIFKALNYIHLNKFDDAYVEVHRISDKLKELNTYYKEDVAKLNNSKDNKLKINPKDLGFYNDAFADYISHLIYRASGEEDNSRISLEQAKQAWEHHADVYNYPMPRAIDSTTNVNSTMLNVIAFTGKAPGKIPIGARITTFDGYFTISDPSLYHIQPIPFPGLKNGWNFKFEFPAMKEEGTSISQIKVYIDSIYAGNLQLLENIANVATKTFESQKSITFFKTALRAVAKGISAGQLGKTIKKNTNSGGLGDVLAFVLNAAVDATEHADLRTWRTIPGYSFVGEFPISEGKHTIEILFLDNRGNVLQKDKLSNYLINKKLNVLESFYLD